MSTGLREASATPGHHQDLWACHKIQYSLEQRLWFQTLQVTYLPSLGYGLSAQCSEPLWIWSHLAILCLLLGEHGDCPINTLKTDRKQLKASDIKLYTKENLQCYAANTTDRNHNHFAGYLGVQGSMPSTHCLQ